ncbi:hypothetical protein HAX54_021810, partial [Datura stramonium]|nr:hypothetical protein [Datura stramonium]
MEIEVVGKGLKRLLKGTKGASSSSSKASSGPMALEFLDIRDKFHELEVGYILVEPKEFTLTMVREFYENWDTSFEESTKVKISGQ